MSKGRRGTPNRPKEPQKIRELDEFNQYITAVQNTADIPDVLERNITLIDNMRSAIEGDKNKHERFKAYLKSLENQNYYSRKKMESHLASIEDTSNKLTGAYDWPSEGEDLKKKTRPKLNEYAIKLQMDPDEVMGYKTKDDLIAAINKSFDK